MILKMLVRDQKKARNEQKQMEKFRKDWFFWEKLQETLVFHCMFFPRQPILRPPTADIAGMARTKADQRTTVPGSPKGILQLPSGYLT